LSRAPHRNRSLGCSLVGCLLFGTPARASGPAEAPNDLTSLSLNEFANLDVTVVSRRGEAQGQTPAAVYVLTAEDLARSGTVGDSAAFAERGGMIGLRVEGDRVRCDININEVAPSGPRISSEVLKLARLVVTRELP